MWQCDNCGYTDEDGTTFEEEASETNPDEVVRYCPECGSDEVYPVEEEDDDFEDDDDEVVITLNREVERNLPAFLSRLFESRQNVEMVERWSLRGGARQGRFTLKVGLYDPATGRRWTTADGADSVTLGAVEAG